jgi:hypothetical protein
MWHSFHSGKQMEQVRAVRFLRNGSIGSGKVVDDGLKYTSSRSTSAFISSRGRESESLTECAGWNS